MLASTPAKHPISFDNSRASVPQDPDESAKPNVPVTSSAAAARGRKVINAAALVGAAPSKFT